MYVTPKRCPKCRYERQPADTAPGWQCPSCGVAYAKVEGSAAPVGVENRRLGGGGVPMIVVGDQLVSGFNEQRLTQLLEPWMR
jgi:hypothetical protein